MVWQLKKALYGLKQASREWYKKLSGELNFSLGFTRIQANCCIFYKNVNGHHLIIGVYIYLGDNLIVSDWPDLVAQTKKDLSSRFKMYLGEVHWILNKEVTRDRPNRTIRLSQAQYYIETMEWPNANQQLPLWR
jgi:hypothetical protein